MSSGDGWQRPSWIPVGVDVPERFPVLGQRTPIIPRAVPVAAYEVYAKIEGPQIDLITAQHRGGFSVLELAAYLYARGFPPEEWSWRVDQALCRRQWAVTR